MEPVSQSRVFSGRYEITHLIARGGMAQVYRAQDNLLDREVALKVLFPELSIDQNFVERFRREAQSAARLSHPNIVPVFDWGEDHSTYFIVMEYVDGQPLSHVIKDLGTVPPKRAAVIAANVAAGLAYAHRRGMVHRDIKPGNVLITEDGSVRVTDFGIARAVNTEDDLTQAGSVMGTATYFSPEQAEGKAVDGRSDIYSLGVVLYEMLLGRPPFQGDSPVAVASMHVRNAVPLPRDLAAGIPEAIEAITMKALSKDPALRYQDAEEMRADLMRFVDDKPVTAEDPTLALAMSDTAMVAAVNQTMAIPIFTGPRSEPLQVAKAGKPLSRQPLVWGLVAVALVAVVIAGLLFANGSKSKQLTMPNLVGMTQTKAVEVIQKDGLILGTVSTVASSKPANQVVSTTPIAGLPLSKGVHVDMTVSNGALAGQVQMPSVVGQTLGAAEAQLTAAGLTGVPSSQGSPSSAIVQAQSVSAGSTVPLGTQVTLSVPVVSVQVPSVAGQSVAQATTTLQNANLTAGQQTTVCSNSRPSGSVASSSPPVGTSVPSGTSITLNVSSGNCTVIIQNVVGLTQGGATTALQGQGLSVVATAATQAACTMAGIPNGSVQSQSPVGGSSVNGGSTVTIAVCPNTVTTTTGG